MSPSERSDLQAVEYLHTSYERIRQEIGKVIIGQDKVIEQLLISLLSSGHCLLVGVPGLAKTLLISTLSRVLNLKFSRIQFTPDLMPSDITGTEIIEEDQASRRRDFRFVKGPVFANIILADEINRTPPKTQAALLQAMQEHEVTASGVTYKLDEPFFVLATQNPIEQEGTYPLPEAQLDRFMFNVFVDYPSALEERDIVKSTTTVVTHQLDKVLSPEEIIGFQQLVRGRKRGAFRHLLGLSCLREHEYERQLDRDSIGRHRAIYLQLELHRRFAHKRHRKPASGPVWRCRYV